MQSKVSMSYRAGEQRGRLTELFAPLHVGALGAEGRDHSQMSDKRLRGRPWWKADIALAPGSSDRQIENEEEQTGLH